MNFHQQSVGKKLFIAFSILVIILVGVSIIAIQSLSQAQQDFDGFVSDEFSRGSLARDIRAAASARAISARNLIILNGPEDIRAESLAVQVAHDRVQERLALLKSTVAKAQGVGADERALLDKIDKLEQQYGPVALAIVAKAVSGQKEAAILQMNEQCQPLLKQLISSTSEYSKLIAAAGGPLNHRAF